MSDESSERRVFSLYEVARSIQSVLASRYKRAYWIEAEINKLNFYEHSGHCFPELVEKKEGRVITELRATLWKANFERIDQRFKEVTREPLKEGITVLIQATVVYHELYGLSLNILDIDPGYSLGVLAREKQETILRLKKEGVFNQNKALSFPLIPKRIAIISVQTSKGLADFTQILNQNPWNYDINYSLFPAILQGERAAATIGEQLRNIETTPHRFHAVAIIRGGGGDIGLSCYNDYSLCHTIATFPIPVLTGIGHATNETVGEMVAFKSAITPSMLADFLLQRFHNAYQPVQEAENLLHTKVKELLSRAYERQDAIAKQFASACYSRVRLGRQSIEHLQRGLDRGAFSLLRNKERELNELDKQLLLLNPESTLKRGYSITYHKNKPVFDARALKPGDKIKTRLLDGEIESIVSS